MKVEITVQVVVGDTAVRLQKGPILSLVDEGIGPYEIALLKSLLNISKLLVYLRTNIARISAVELGRSFGQGLFHRENGWQFLIIHFKQGGGPKSGFKIHGSHGGYLISRIPT